MLCVWAEQSVCSTNISWGNVHEIYLKAMIQAIPFGKSSVTEITLFTSTLNSDVYLVRLYRLGCILSFSSCI